MDDTREGNRTSSKLSNFNLIKLNDEPKRKNTLELVRTLRVISSAKDEHIRETAEEILLEYAVFGGEKGKFNRELVMKEVISLKYMDLFKIFSRDDDVRLLVRLSTNTDFLFALQRENLITLST